MKEQWTKLAARVNAMSLRERFLLFASVVAVLGAITDRLFISPLIEQQKILVAQIDKKSTDMEIRRAETNLELLKRGRDRAKVLNADIVNAQGDIDTVEREIAALSATGGDAAAMSAILARVLQRSEKVGLVRIVQVGAESGTVAPATAGATRGGLDITLSGGYLDLMEYLAALEKALPRARWGGLKLNAEAVPAQVTVRIVTTVGDS
jgi:MSHA biogenesis protein MshJ